MSADEPSEIFRLLCIRGPDFWLDGTPVRAFEVAASELKPQHLKLLLDTLKIFAEKIPQVVAVEAVARAIDAVSLSQERCGAKNDRHVATKLMWHVCIVCSHESVREVVQNFGGYAVETNDELHEFLHLLSKWGPETAAVRKTLIQELEDDPNGAQLASPYLLSPTQSSADAHVQRRL